MNLTTDSTKTVDINELIVKYVKRYPFPSELKKNIDFKNLTYDNIEDSGLVIDQETTVYEPRSLTNDNTRTPLVITGVKIPKSSVIFSCIFRNQTSEPQENTLETSRETRSTTNISMSKSILKEGSFNLQLQAPSSIMQANSGFKKSVTIDRRREYNLEETLTWTANSKVLVQPNKQIKADLEISEEELHFNFQVKITISGELKVYLTDKKTKWKRDIPLEIDDLTSVFTVQDGFITNADKSVSFVCSGSCYSRFGVSQNLNLVESDIKESIKNCE